MKRLFTFLFALLSACTFSAYAAIVDGTCGDNLTWTLNTEDSTFVISGIGAMTDFPSWYDYASYIKYVTVEDGVTSIGNHAFFWCYVLTSVTIGNSVTSIGNDAFYECSGLTSVVWNAENCADFSDFAAPFYYSNSQITSFTFGDSVQHIPAYLCREMNSLTSITIPNSVTSIGEGAFYECSGLTSITIPNSVTSIEDYAFYECSGLTSITIPNSVTSIGKRAFISCSGLTSITIPENVETIGNYAFAYCSGLTSVTIGNSVTSIGESAFLGCRSLTSITIPENVETIGNDAFSSCSGLTSITIGSGVTSIGEGAFASCSSLTSITIPNSVTSIGDRAFNQCSSLTEITIPNSVTSIGEGAFAWCSSLAVVNVEATAPPTLGADVFTSSPTCNIPCGTLEVYQASDWQNVVGEFVEQCSDDSGDDGDMDKDLTIVFSDRDNNQISAQTVTLRVPVTPQIAGFTFLYWLPVAEPVEDVITLQAVYESNTPTAAPEVFVNPSNPAQKLIRNGQVYILHEDKMYTISGQVVK